MAQNEKEYIQNSERLVGCNLQIIKGFGWYTNKEGEIFKITEEGGYWYGTDEYF